MNCPHCDGKCRKASESKSLGCGCLVVVLGAVMVLGGAGTALFFIPSALMIPLGIVCAAIGLALAARTEAFWVCRVCKSKFPRHSEAGAVMALLIVLAVIFWACFKSLS